MSASEVKWGAQSSHASFESTNELALPSGPQLAGDVLGRRQRCSLLEGLYFTSKYTIKSGPSGIYRAILVQLEKN